MKKIIILITITAVCKFSFAQYKGGDDATTKGFKKENLFTGGGVTVSFSNYTTVLGASPIIGYSLTKWLDAGLLFNYNYSSDRHVTYTDQSGNYYVSDDRLKQHNFGPGAFFRAYPINFLFVQGQAEMNFTALKFIPANGGPTEKDKVSAPSFLVGAGYCSGREGPGSMFYYVSIMADVLKDKNSPYVELTANGVRILPIIRAGFQIPLFQGKSKRRFDL
ncbi:MAG: hypothetical protein ABJA78_14370 [Ferruginibacter sp.]